MSKGKDTRKLLCVKSWNPLSNSLTVSLIHH